MNEETLNPTLSETEKESKILNAVVLICIGFVLLAAFVIGILGLALIIDAAWQVMMWLAF